MTFKILACLLAVSTLASGQSGVLREVWTQVDGGTINALVTSPNYPEAPLFSTLQTEFRSATNWGDRYGVRMRALLTAPATGDYTFWISGDDTCELYLSTTDNPANKVRIARAPAWTALDTWTTYPEQRSTPVSLVAGSRYYIEALMKESTGGDSLSVAMATAPSTTPVVLAGSALTPFLATGAAPSGVVVQAGREIVQYSPNLTVQLSAQALHMANTSRSPTFAWSQVSGAAAVIKTPADGNTTVELPAAGTYVFRVTATVNGGTGTDDVTVKVLPKLAPDAGTALAQYWFNVSGATIAALTGSVDYPNFPHAHRVVTSLSAALDQGDQFGSRTRGFILAPATGSYRFFVAGDSTAEFWLSPDATAANVQRRCQVTSAVTAENYFGRDEQASSVIALEAGKRYAFELRHKDDSGGDHCSVLWQQPGSDYVTEVSTEFIAPPADAAAVKAATSPFDQNSDFILNAGRDQVLYRPQMNTALSAYESRRYPGSDTPTRAWTKVSGPGTVIFSDSGLAQTNVVFSTTGTYLLRYSVTTQRNVSADEVRIEVRASINANTGALTRQVWWNRNFADLAAFKADPTFPNTPDITDNVQEFRQVNDWADLYATRVTGILNVPGTGSTPVNHFFYCSGSDVVEFSISTDATPANLRAVCFTTKSSGRETYTSEASQVSAAVPLKPGRYFVQLLHKEQYGSDHFSVAWSTEHDKQVRLISGSYLEPAQSTSIFSPSLNTYATAGRDRTYWWPHSTATLSGGAIRRQNSSTPVTYEWRKIGGPVATFSATNIAAPEVTFSGVGVYIFELAATEGTTTHRDTMSVRINNAQPNVSGFLTRSLWFDVSGTRVTDLLAIDPTLTNPHHEDLLPGAEPPQNWADYYGQRLQGTVTVPISGNYTFAIGGDDTADFKIDLKDGNGLVRLAYLEHAEGFRNFDAHTYQKTTELPLTAGIAYPIEITHKEQDWTDHLSVALEGPATNGREILSRGFLSPARNAPAFNPDITVALGIDRTLLWPTPGVTLAAMVYDLKQGPQALTYRWSSSSTAVSFDAPTGPVSGVKFTGPGTYEIKMTVSDGENTGSDTLLITVRNPLNSGSGGILREVWTNVPGYYLTDLTNSAAYAKPATFTDVVSNFETPVNIGDNYGQRLTGCLSVATEGDYVFLISSDDQSELWFNATGEAPEGAVKIANVPWASGRYSYGNASQISASFRLVPGKKYYVKALQKEGGGDDYLAVAYRRADQPNKAAMVIPGVMLTPPAGASTRYLEGQIAVDAGEGIDSVWPKARYSLKGIAMDYTPGPQALAYRWSVVSGTSAAARRTASSVVFSTPTALTTDVEFPAAGTYQVQLTATDGVISSSDTLTVTLKPQLAAGTGSILSEVFSGITGSWVTDLTRNAKYPNSPDRRSQLTKAEITPNQGDNYGVLVRGFVYAPTTGVYRFNIASDDWGEAYLSTDRTPENKALLCFTPAATDYYEWRKYPEYQLSRPITLTAGQSYYLEIRMKESGWRDHLSLAWLRPGTSTFEVIDGPYLAPLKLNDAISPTITLTGGTSVTIGVGQTYTDPGFTATDGTDGDLNSRVTTEGMVDANTPGTYQIRYTVTDASGNQSKTITRSVTVAVAPGEQPTYPADKSGAHSTVAWTPPAKLTDTQAARFLKQASFGPDDASVAKVKALGIAGWINEQLALPPTLQLEQMDRIARYQGARSNLLQIARTADMAALMPGGMMSMSGSTLRTNDRLYAWWTSATTAPDQLRQRVAFALSEILVVSDLDPTLQNYPRGVASYYDILVRRAFGNYRDILEEVTLNPMMGIWLTSVRSSKTKPNENYGREIMQLFSIGLEHLNRDGTFKRDVSGNAIPTYTQTEIVELSRALTGWTFAGSPSFTSSGPVLDQINPMIAFEDQHDRDVKIILGGATIPAGQTAYQDMKRGVDVIFNHPNVGPFIARRLIQRLVTSNPSAAYIYRVAGKFDNNGAGVRGDLAAVVKSILCDPEARNPLPEATGGKVSEPILRLVRLLRAFPKPPSDSSPVLGRYMLNNMRDKFNQAPFQSPTVFNFFHVNFQPQGPIQNAGLVAPEIEIHNPLSTTDTSNYFFDGVRYGFPSDASPSVSLDLAGLISLAATPDALLARIETLLLARPMSADLRSSLLSIHTAYAGSPTEQVQNILSALCSVPEFVVER